MGKSLFEKLVMLAATQKDVILSLNEKQKPVASGESSLKDILISFKDLALCFLDMQGRVKRVGSDKVHEFSSWIKSSAFLNDLASPLL